MSNLQKLNSQEKINPAQQLQSEKIVRQQQDTQFQFYDIKQIHNYFNTLNRTSISQQKSDFYTYQRFINLTQSIYTGDLSINPQSINIDSLLAKQKINQEQHKTNQLKHKKQSILKQLSLLDQQLSIKNKKINPNHSLNTSRITSNTNQQDKDNHSTNPINQKLILSKNQHQQLIKKILKSKEQRQKHKLQIKLKQQQKLKQIQQKQKLTQLQKSSLQKKQKIQQIEEKLKKNKQKHQKFLQNQKQSTKKVQQIKNKKFLYQEIQQKFQMQVKMPLLQQQKKLLREKRQFAKAYSIDEIKNHQRAYLQLRQNSIKKSQVNQTESLKQVYKAPAKSEKLQKILQQQKLEQRQKLMQKKRAIQEKLQRQQNYVEYLKENFSKVKIDKNKEQEIKSRIQKSQVKRQEIDLRSIGINYLQQAKKLRRKTARENNNLTEKEELKNEQNQGNITVLSQQAKKDKKPQSRMINDTRGNNLIKKRQQKIQILINNTSLNDAQRIRKLKMETDKINEAFKMKQQMLRYGYNQKVQDEAVELLLTSIQAKMGIIDIGKEKLTVKY